MNTRIRALARMLALLGLVMVAASAAVAFGDCSRGMHASEVLNRPATLSQVESAVPMGDPGLDGMFARYADLHRDAVGYALVEVADSPIYANAVPVTPAPLAR